MGFSARLSRRSGVYDDVVHRLRAGLAAVLPVFSLPEPLRVEAFSREHDSLGVQFASVLANQSVEAGTRFRHRHFVSNALCRLKYREEILVFQPHCRELEMRQAVVLQRLCVMDAVCNRQNDATGRHARGKREILQTQRWAIWGIAAFVGKLQLFVVRVFGEIAKEVDRVDFRWSENLVFG